MPRNSHEHYLVFDTGARLMSNSATYMQQLVSEGEFCSIPCEISYRFFTSHF